MIEDDEDAREVLAAFVSQMGIEVRCACDGAEALRVLDEGDGEAPALVLSDVLLPGVLGISIVEFIKREPRLANTAVALVTGSPELVEPGTRVFRKPANLPSLKEFIATAISDRAKTPPCDPPA